MCQTKEDSLTSEIIHGGGNNTGTSSIQCFQWLDCERVENDLGGYSDYSRQVVDSKWWPETGSNRRRRPFQGRLASELSTLESADIIETISVVASSIQDGLGPFGMVSTVRWSCIGRDLQTVR
jgi:hypothetical protein